MTDARRKTKIALLEAGLTFRDLEQATGLKRGTIHNLLSDPSGSAKAKQAITNFLGVEIWPEIPVTKRRVLFTHGIEIKFPASDTAFQFAQRFPAGYVNCRGAKVFFLRSIPFILESINENGSAACRTITRTDENVVGGSK